MSDPNDTVLTQAQGGAEIPRSAEDAALLQGLGTGSHVISTAGHDAAAREGRRAAMFDNGEDTAVTFAEGIVDALSLGFIRETGDYADERRGHHPYASFGGQAVGTAIGLMVEGPAGLISPVKRLARGGEKLGEAVAKQLLKREGDDLAAMALREAGAGAALTGATSFGHQFMDAVIENREFSSSAILDDIKLGALLGGAGGVVMGGFSKLASRAQVREMGGLVGDGSEALGAVREVHSALDNLVEHHAQQVGVLKALRDADRLGPVSDGFYDVRKAALSNAKRAQQALKDIDLDAALSGADVEAYKALQKATKRYREASRELDEAMRPRNEEIAQGMDRSADTIVDVAPRHMTPGKGTTPGSDEAAFYLSQRMAAAPELRARYEQMHGRAWEDPFVRTPEGTPSATPQRGTMAGGGGDGDLGAKAGDLAALNDLVEKLPVPGSAQESASNALRKVTMEPGSAEAHPDAAIAQMWRKKNGGKDTQMRRAGALRQGPDVPVAPSSKPLPPSKGYVTELDPSPRGADPTKVIERQADPAAPVMSATPGHTQQMDAWFDTKVAPRVRPWDEAEARMQQLMQSMYEKAGGRFDSAAALGLMEKAGVKPSDDAMGSYLDQLWSLRRAAHFAAQEARGIASPLREAGMDAVLGFVAKKAVGSTGAGIAVSVLAGLLGFGGRLSAATGALYRKAITAVDAFFTATKVRSLAAAATNTAWSYSERGPIEDPVERIEEIKYLAANPESVRERVRKAAGDLAVVSPEQVAALEEHAIAQMGRLAIRAPAFYYDKLGRPLNPPAGKMREFFEFENGINDLGTLLDAVKTGSITRAQVDALQMGWGPVHVKVAAYMLKDPDKLQALSRAQLRVVEMVTGVPLTGHSDPMFLARQQQAWQPPSPPAPPGKAQALNINPDGAPTPAQSNATGRAPGN
jgi:hypothetical protein